MESLKNSPAYMKSFMNEAAANAVRHETKNSTAQNGKSYQYSHQNTNNSKQTNGQYGAPFQTEEVVDEKQVTIIMLLAHVCSVYDPTPKTFVANVLRFYRLGILDSISFLTDLGLLPAIQTASTTTATRNKIAKLAAKAIAATSFGVNDGNVNMAMNETLNVSRYQREFEEIKAIGKGGFGQVFMARHKLDGNLYAIKKVTFFNKGYQSPLIQKVLREVKCLAKCDHTNVNRYYSAWLEPTWLPVNQYNTPYNHQTHKNITLQKTQSLYTVQPKENRKLLHDICELVEPISEGTHTSRGKVEYLSSPPYYNTSFIDEVAQSPQSDKSYYSSNGRYSSNSVFEFEYDDDADDQQRASFSDLPLSGKEHTTKDLQIVQKPNPTKSTIFTTNTTNSAITTVVENKIVPASRSKSCSRQLSTKDTILPAISLQHLEEAILDKDGALFQNHLLNDLNDMTGNAFTYQITLYIQMYLCDQSTLQDWLDNRNKHDGGINVQMNLNLFRQLVEGLIHVHENGIVHRDLKPSNVFMTQNGCLKIGDFGLSKLLHEAVHTNSNDKCTTTSRSYFTDASFSSSSSSSHTSGVGTVAYASPEQVDGQIYDLKADSYSLGIILLELFLPFRTKMERAKALADVRKEPPILSDSLVQKYPNITELILCLVAPTSCRMSTIEVRDYLNTKFPIIQLENAQEVFHLRHELQAKQSKLDEQEAIIERLRMQVAQLTPIS